MSEINDIMLRMRVFSLWMTARGKDIAPMGTDPDTQLDDIEHVLEQRKDHIAVLHDTISVRAIRIAAQQDEIKQLKTALALATMRASQVARAHEMEALHRERAAHYAAIGKAAY